MFVISCQANSTRYFIWSECAIKVHGETNQSTYEYCEENLAISSWIIGPENSFLQTKQPYLSGESDADWSGDQNDCKSATGFYFKYGQHSGALSWQVRKKQTVALLSCEAEYQGLASFLSFLHLLIFRWINKI